MTENLSLPARIEKTLRQDPDLLQIMSYAIMNVESELFGDQGEPEDSIKPDLEKPITFISDVKDLIETQFEGLQTRKLTISGKKLILSMALPEDINPDQPDKLIIRKGERTPEFLISVVKRERLDPHSNDPQRVITSAGYLIEIARQDIYIHPRLGDVAFNRTHGFQIELGEDGRMVVRATKYEGTQIYSARPRAVSDPTTVCNAIQALNAMNVF
jgi:hypothetical protein